MAEVSFRITVDGATESQQEVERVRQALSGVQADLDGASAASRIFGVSQGEVSQAMKQTVVEISAIGPYALQSADALKQGATGMRTFGDSTRSAHQELFETARLTRSFVDVLVGSAVPGLSTATGVFTRLSRETSGFTVAQVAATAGALALAAAIGQVLALGKQYVDVQNAANAAVASMDFTAATAGLAKATQAISDYDQNWQRFLTTFTDNSKTASLADYWAGVYSLIAVGVQKLKGGMIELTAEENAWAEATRTTFDLTGESQLKLATLTAQISEERAQLELARNAAATYPDLSATYEREADGIRRLADERANQAIQEALVLDIRLRTAGLTEEADRRMAQVAAAAAAARGAAYAQADQVIIKGAEDVAAKRAQEFADAGRLAQIYGQAASEAIAAASAEVNARLQAAQVDADYYGSATANLTTYQAQRRALIVAGANEELATIERVYQADRQAQLARITGLQAGSAGHRAALAQLEQLDAANAANRQKVQDDLRGKLIQNDAQVVQEHRANVDRMKALDQELLASGRAAADAAIAALKEQGAEWVNIAAVESRAAAQREQAQQTLSTYLRGGAVDAKALAEAFAQADMAARNAATAGSGFGSRIAMDARAALEALQGITPTAGEVASALGVVGTKAAEMSREAATSIDAPIRKLTTLDDVTGELAVTFTNAGEEAGSGLASGIAAGAQQIPAMLSSDAAGLRAGVIATFTDVGQAAGASLSSGIAAGLGQTAWASRFDEAFAGILAAVDRFYAAFNAKIAAGTSRVGDTIYEGFISRVIARLDEEAARA